MRPDLPLYQRFDEASVLVSTLVQEQQNFLKNHPKKLYQKFTEELF